MIEAEYTISYADYKAANRLYLSTSPPYDDRLSAY